MKHVDGSLVPPGDDPADAAELLFTAVCSSYVHLRARQGLRALIAPGLGAVPAGPPAPAAP
jgi:hypothetical protein